MTFDLATIYHYHHLAARSLLPRETRGQLGQATARNLFMKLRQLARHCGLSLAQDFARVQKRLMDAVRGFVKDQS